MPVIARKQSVEHLQEVVQPLEGSSHDYDSLIARIAEARYILLGEATHGTHEFYRARAEITKRLIQEKGVTVIAWEADWPDALRVNRYIQGRSADSNAREALGGFRRFPNWMWKNADILELVHWLRSYNENLPPKSPRVGVYGLDLYSLHSSIDAVVSYLEERDPEGAREARLRYSCFEAFGEDPEVYGRTAGLDRLLSCEEEVVQQLQDLQRKTAALLSQDGRLAADELFFARQNAVVARNAEEYYRAMYRGRPNTWNLRDKHMVVTLDRLMEHLQSQGEPPKAVVWAHNSHLGDARATSMGNRGEWNVGQLTREWHAGETALVGFTTYQGTVTAASDWGANAERKRVRPALEGSYERLFHQVGIPRFFLDLRAAHQLEPELLERAIGVLYLPETERWSHYFFARLPEQFDAVLHFDTTRAVQPLDPAAEWERGELPETYPSAL